MANFEPQSTFDNVRIIEPSDRVLGGKKGAINVTLQQLVNRTEKTKDDVVALSDKVDNDIATSISNLSDKVDNDITVAISNLSDKVDNDVATALDTANTNITAVSNKLVNYLGTKYANGYEGMTTNGGADNTWIRTTQTGILPYTPATLDSATCSIGHPDWYFANIYATTFNGTATSAYYADYAEFFPKGEDTEEGDIIALDETSSKEQYVKATDKSICVVGVHSESYGYSVGGEETPTGNNYREYQKKKYIPVGLMGRVKVKFMGKAILGGKVVPSHIKGVGRLYNKDTDSIDSIVGYLVETDNLTEQRLLKIKLGK